ncbi:MULTISPECIES: hypothetical protein [Pseudomonas]|uniref:Uncharacterized protein n=1 Tax=Pseudomonas cucumis TaxID=2954082 RepID=A0ABY9F4G8_9PSED|nr:MULTISPECIES: hypothetical protein [Pseudomonas]MDR8362953.1 hypothetical protein [Pseudomonas sp. JL3]URM30997.1 hypothetical protein LLY42_21620 [Pseudomonas frederiksbergensis]WLG87814.1 hypothetical protein PSH97_13385 [Pseudomonas cucumis]WLG93423.1 hypothetical protein PSH72_14010 [Pseudomonas cucumis]
MPAAMGENDATTQGQESKQGNQQCDSTKHFKILDYRRNEVKTRHRL